jgi:WD40 repeat protein/serine/threonine protein kinase
LGIQENPIGQFLRGYELRERVGAGAFGAVYRAFQPTISREVAIKVILPTYANQPEFTRRFEAEAQLVARLEHPHIVPLYDYWRDPDGAYLVMRFLRGGSLRGLIEQGAVGTETTIHVIEQVAAALNTAHQRHVIHRDIKPDNILLDEDGNAYLADFGIAKDVNQLIQDSGDEETVSGSPAYISPEQITGSLVSPQTDIYGLGIVIYELLSGELPFAGANLSDLLMKHLSAPLPELRSPHIDLPEEVDAVIRKATQKRPEDRYASVLELSSELRRVLSSPTLSGAHDLLEHTDAPVARRIVISDDLLTTQIAVPTRNPYKGLQAFQEADADDFFGREDLIKQIIERLAEPADRFLAVVGPSGSGKSSVVKAGVLPALRRGALPGSRNWFFVEMTPSSDIFTQLEEALLRAAVNRVDNLSEVLRNDFNGLTQAVNRLLPAEGDLVLVIDQFEEVFTLVTNEDDREHFLNSLYTAAIDPASRLHVIVTLRADFYDRPLLYEGFGALVQTRTQVVLPMSANELEQAIVSPAKRVNIQVDADLLAAIIADVRDEPGALPLLQYALTEVFEHRDGHRMTLAAYRDIGGMLGVLARRANMVYEGLSELQQSITQQIFLRLVTQNEQARDTRRRARRTEFSSLGDTAAVQAVLDAFGQYRLLTFDRQPDTREPTVEIAHEALLAQWTLLRGWLETYRADLRQLAALSGAANDWRKSGGERSYLLRGARLNQIEEWAAHTGIPLAPEEQSYLDASIAQRQTELAAEQERSNRERALERHSRMRLRALVAVFLVSTVIGLVLSVLAFSQRQAAQEAQQSAQNEAFSRATQEQIALAQAATATNALGLSEQRGTEVAFGAATAIAAESAAVRRADEAQSLALAFASQQALTADNGDLALALALEANQIPNALPQAAFQLAQAAYAPGTWRVYAGAHDGWLSAVAASPDQRYLITAGNDGRLVRWNVASGEQDVTEELGENFIDVGGQRAATEGVNDMLFIDATTLLFASAADLVVWDVENWREIRRMSFPDLLLVIDASRDGTLALAGYSDGDIILWDILSGERVRTFRGHQQQITDIAFSPDARRFASSSWDDTLRVWDTKDGSELLNITPGVEGSENSDVTAVTFNPDNTTVYAAVGAGDIVEYALSDGEEINRFDIGDTMSKLTFVPQSSLLAYSAYDFSTNLINPDTGQIVRRFLGHAGAIIDIEFSPDGLSLYSVSQDSTARRWHVTSGAAIGRYALYPTGTGISDILISADETHLYTSGGEGDPAIVIWNAQTGEIERRLERHTDSIVGLSPHPTDPQRLLSSSWDGTIREWNLATGEILQTFNTESILANVAEYLPNGTEAIFAWLERGTMGVSHLTLWDLEQGQQVREYETNIPLITTAILNQDASRILVGGADIDQDGNYGQIALFDTGTGEQVLRFAPAHTGGVLSAVFSPDERYVVSAGDDGLIVLWDAGTGQEIRRFVGHSDVVRTALFSPDGSSILSAGYDGFVILWDVATGEEILRFSAHEGRAQSITFTADGQRAFSGGLDGEIALWQVSVNPDVILSWLSENRYVRPLSCGELARYLAATC